MVTNFDYYRQIENPNMYLCNPDLRAICALNARDRSVTLRFNDLSELSFVVDKTESIAEKDYERIKTKRLVFLEDIGWFQITNAQEVIEGDACYKTVTAKSHQVAFQERGFISEERAYMFYNPYDPTDRLYDSTNTAAIPSVVGQLVQQCGLKLSGTVSTDTEPTRDYEKWTLIYVSPVLKFKAKSFSEMYVSGSDTNVVRHFEENNGFGYDFMVNDVQNAFQVLFEFDYMHHTIKVKTLDEAVIPTDICLSFSNLVNTMNVTENADDIVTVLTCEGGDLDITTVNPMGTGYIVDFSYYMQTVDDYGNPYPWMSKELIAAINEWQKIYDSEVDDYSELVLNLQTHYLELAEWNEQLQFANLRNVDIKNAVDQYVSSSVDGGDASQVSITAEEVEVGGNSMLPASKFYNTDFTDSTWITGYKNRPTVSQNGTSYYLSGSSKSGTAASMITDYIVPPEEGDDPDDCYLYFQDNDTSSYCRLTIEAEVDVAKNGTADGSISIPIPSGTTGYVVLNGNTFRVYNAQGVIKIYNNSNGQEVSYVSGHSDYFDFNGARYQYAKSADDYVTVTRFYVSGFTRHTVYANLTGSDGWQALWEKKAAQLEASADEVQEDIDELLVEIQEINDKCNIQKFILSKGDELYDELYHYWIEGNYTNDNLSADSETSMADRITLAKQLMEDGAIELQRAAQPKFTFTADVINFLRLIDYREFSTQLELGRTVTIEKNDSTYYFPALTAISFDLDDADNFSLTFSNGAKPNETAMTIADLLKEASDISRTVTSNWADLTDYAKNKETITSLIDEPLNRALRSMQEGLSNQEFIIDQTGILGRRYTDDSHTEFSPEQVRFINNMLVFTDDSWKTVKTALGKIEVGGDVKYGLVAEYIVGNFILGDSLLIGSESGNVNITDNGVVIKNGAIDIYNGDTLVFYADDEGNLHIKGIIDAEVGGTIGGYTIGATNLTSGGVGMSSDTTDGAIAFWAGNENAASAVFRVSNTGELYATKAIIKGDSRIAGFTVNDSAIYNGRSSLKNEDDNGVYIGTDGISLGADNGYPAIYMTPEGYFRATNVSIEGKATLSELIASGSCEFQECYIFNLTSPEAQINKLFVNGFQISGGNIASSDEVLATVRYEKRQLGTQISTYFIIELTSNGSPYTLLSNRTFRIRFNRYTWVMGTSTDALDITITAGNSQTEQRYNSAVNYDISNLVFSDSGTSTLTFNESEAASGFFFYGDLLPPTTLSYNIGSGSRVWKEGYFQRIHGETDEGSDRKIKTEIKDLALDLSEKIIYGLEPKTYKFKTHATPRTQMGFIAQEVENLLNSIGYTTEDVALVNKSQPYAEDNPDNSYSLKYTALIAPLIKVVQSLAKRIDELSR